MPQHDEFQDIITMMQQFESVSVANALASAEFRIRLRLRDTLMQYGGTGKLRIPLSENLPEEQALREYQERADFSLTRNSANSLAFAPTISINVPDLPDSVVDAVASAYARNIYMLYLICCHNAFGFNEICDLVRRNATLQIG